MSGDTNVTSSSHILSLAQTIITQTQLLDEHIRTNDLPEPSFNTDAPIEPFKKATSEVESARTAVIEAAIEIRQLLEGPVKALLPESNFAPLAAIYRFNIATHVPQTGSISFTDLATKCSLLPHDLARVVRYTAIHHRVFQEPKPGYVAHTAASKLLSENPKIADVMGLTFAECWPAHARAVDAMAQRSEEPNVTGYALANDTNLNTFDFLNEHPERAKRFAGAMSSTSNASLDALARYFDWAGLPEGSVVVDIGGSRGHVSVYLAQRFRQLRFVMQDMPEVVRDAEKNVPGDVADRIDFMGHDMFTEQPIKIAAVYLLRFVLHDWSDKYCVKVLKQLIPALTHVAKTVIQDHLLPEPGSLVMLQEMQIRSMDAIMLSLFNSRERTTEDWLEMIKGVDSRFVDVRGVQIKENPTTGIIVATWDGDRA